MSRAAWVLVSFLGLFILYAPSSMACGGGTPPSIEAWQRSASGLGFDLIVKDDDKRYYVPEDDGLMMSVVLYSAYLKQYTDIAKSAKYKIERDRPTPYESCPAHLGGKKITVAKNFPLFKEALLSEQRLLDRLTKRPGPKGIIMQEPANHLRAVTAREEFQKATQSYSFDLQEWCRLGVTLANVGTIVLTYKELSQDHPAKSFAGLNPKSDLPGKIAFGQGEPRPSALNQTFVQLRSQLHLPSDQKAVMRSGCNVSEVFFEATGPGTTPIERSGQAPGQAAY